MSEIIEIESIHEKRQRKISTSGICLENGLSDSNSPLISSSSKTQPKKTVAAKKSKKSKRRGGSLVSKSKKISKKAKRQALIDNPVLTRKIVKNFGKAMATFASSNLAKDIIMEYVQEDN